MIGFPILELYEEERKTLSLEDTLAPRNSSFDISNSFKESNISSLISTFVEFECTSCDRLWLWGYPTIMALGFVGNALCLVAFAGHKLRRETRVLCTLLAAFDTLALLTAFASRWPDAAFGISPVNLHLLLCYIITFANYWLPELAAWTLVGISIERVFSGTNFQLLCIIVINHLNKLSLSKYP